MVTDGDVLTKNKVKELLRSATEPKTKNKRRGRDSFFLTSIAIVALVSLTAISYRPSEAVSRAIQPSAPEEISSAPAAIERDPAPNTVTRYPLTTVVKVVFDSGAELYFEYRTAAMFGAVKLAQAEVGEFRLGGGTFRGTGATGSW